MDLAPSKLTAGVVVIVLMLVGAVNVVLTIAVLVSVKYSTVSIHFVDVLVTGSGVSVVVASTVLQLVTTGGV